MSNEYNREKTLAVLTGIVCVLVFLAGTALGGFHAFSVIGIVAGLLALASYVLADVAVAWGSYIDYKESGGPMEWTAWIVKYLLSFYLLINGGCIAYSLFYSSESAMDRSAVIARAATAQKQCLEAGGNQKGRAASCQKTYQATFDAGMKELDGKTAAVSEAELAVKKFLSFPLFHYIPGILGLLGIVAFTLVSKLTTKHEAQPFVVQRQRGGLTMAAHSAPLVVASSYSVTNGRGSTLSLKRNAIRFRQSGMNEKHVTHVSAAEMAVLETFDYKALAAEAVRLRRQKLGNDALCDAIEASTV